MKNDRNILLKIKRRKNRNAPFYWQTIAYTVEDENESIANVLRKLNAAEDVRDTDGNVVTEIFWECSCLQKKCGACAMVINDKPRLACDSILKDYSKTIRLEPLRKFPVVKDLIVDRSIMQENLKKMELWAEGRLKVSDKNEETAYEASRCLQCGCCLEVCPNFKIGGEFYGAAGFTPAARLLSIADKEELRRLKEQYLLHEYRDCGKSLACRNICPAGIDTEQMLIKANRISFARRFL